MKLRKMIPPIPERKVGELGVMEGDDLLLVVGKKGCRGDPSYLPATIMPRSIGDCWAVNTTGCSIKELHNLNKSQEACF